MATRAAAAAAAAATATAECRAREPEGSLILAAAPESEWDLCDLDIAEASKMVAGAMPSSVPEEAATAVLSMASRLARKPEVRAVLAEELGLGRRPLADIDLREVVDKLTAENDALRAQNASARAMLDSRRQQQALVDQLETQNEALCGSFYDVSPPDLFSEEDQEEDQEEATQEEGSPEEAPEDESPEDEAPAPPPVDQVASDAAFAASLEAQDREHLAAKHAQEVADLAFAQHLSALEDDKAVDAIDGDHIPSKAYEDDESDGDSASLGEIALAICGIIIMVALTRKISPMIAKKAGVLCAAALAGIAAHFRRC